MNSNIEYSSYKDKNAQVFYEDGNVFRKINKDYIPVFKKFINSKLYDNLLSENLIIPHKIIEENQNYIIIQPERATITYPWEWSFSQIKDCALATLKIQEIALKHNFSLKDANFFNIQFYKNNPVLIDTTSLNEYKENQIWTAYRQFCENFLSVLCLMSYVDLKMSDLLLKNINGIPLDLTSKLLPIKSYLNFGVLSHIHMLSKFQSKYSENTKKIDAKISKTGLINLIQNLKSTINSLKLPNQKTEWSNYYSFTNYNKESFENKKEIIEEYKNIINPNTVVDFGANTGFFTRIFDKSICYSTDCDIMAVELNYQKLKEDKIKNITPLVFDITNPSCAVGFFNKERKDFSSRINNIDLIIALALIHHLVFTYNLTFEMIAQYFCTIGKYLIIEFIDKNDSKIVSMLKNREDVFDDYNEKNFEEVFNKYYKIISKQRIKGTKRTLYLMEKI